MELPCEKGLDVISPPRVTNISSKSATLTIGLEEDEPIVLEASRIEPHIEAQPVASVSVPSQLTYLLPSSIRSKLISADLERIRTIYGIPDEYQLRAANKTERANWRSPFWVCFYEVDFITGFSFLFPKLIREFFAYFGISPRQVLPNL